MTELSNVSHEVQQLLEGERAALVAAVESVPPGLRERRPSGEAWSVAEVVDHLARVERGIARLIAVRGRERPEGQAAPVPLDDAAVARLRDRNQRIEAPERIRPSGSVSAEEALRALGEARRALIDAVNAADKASLDGCTHAHAVLGVLRLRDWISFVAHHEARHTAQISEIQRAITR